MNDFNSMKISIVIFAAIWALSPEVESNVLRTLRASPEGILRRVRDVSGPSIPPTPKPPCPSYISCPYPPYPKPTTKPPTANEESSTKSPTVEEATQSNSSANADIEDRFGSNTESTSLEPSTTTDVVTSKPTGLGNANGPSISATTKPPCPWYITCPYPPYPRPTTKSPETTPEPQTTTLTPDKELADRLRDESSSSEKPISSETEFEGIKPVGLGNANGPSISATQKPPCPSYISCPYPSYPKPTTKAPSSTEETHPTTSIPDKELTDRIGAESSPAGKPVTPEKSPSSTGSPDKDHDGSESSSEKPNLSQTDSERIKPSGLGNINGPSISATQKPPCPSYITCPYPPYPRPTTKAPVVSEVTPSTSDNSDKDIGDRIGAESSPSEKPAMLIESDSEKSKPANTDNVSGPSISATQKPPCPSYINCPYPSYPRPTTKPPGDIVSQSSTLSPNKDIVDRISSNENPQPQELQNIAQSETVTKSPNVVETTSLPSDNDDRKDGNIVTSVSAADDENQSTQTESIYSSEKPLSTVQSQTDLPSQTPSDWYFPGPSKGSTPNSLSLESPSDVPTGELVEYMSDSDYPIKKPSISATQKPQCPFYASCPYEYPKPTTATPYVNRVLPPALLQANAQATASSNVGNLNNRIQPPLLHSNSPKLVSYFGGDSDGEIESSTVDPIELGNQGAFLPIYSYVYGFDPYGQSNTYYNSFYNRRPSIVLTPRPFWPSYLKNPWIYPRPFGSYVNDQDSLAESNEDDALNGSVEEERDQYETDPNIYN